MNKHVKVRMSYEKVSFVLYADIETMLKLLDEQYREKMNKMTTERKCKTPHPENIDTHLMSVWCEHSTFVYVQVLDPMKIYRGKDCV